jgi:hypothetical protein
MQLHFRGPAMERVHPSFILAGQRVAAAFIGSSLTCSGGVVAVEAQPTLIASTAMQKRIVDRRRRRLWSIDIVPPKSFRFATFTDLTKQLIIRLILLEKIHSQYL